MAKVIVQIRQICRAFGRNQRWYQLGNDKKIEFDTIEEAREWVRETFKGFTRTPIYVDTNSRGTIKTGWYFSTKVKSEGYFQDWVSFSEVVSETRKEIRAIDLDEKKAKSVA